MKKKINSCKIVTNKFPTNTKKIWDLEVEQKKQFLKKIRSSEVVVGSNLSASTMSLFAAGIGASVVSQL
jgi:hypothetical protein